MIQHRAHIQLTGIIVSPCKTPKIHKFLVFHWAHTSHVCLHDVAAAQLLENLGQPLLGHLLDLVILALLLMPTTVLLPTMMSTILLSSAMLSTVLLPVRTSILPAMLPGIRTRILWRIRWRRHMVDTAALQVHEHPALILLCAILQSQLPTHLLHPGLDLLHVIAAMIALADDDMQMRFAALPGHANTLLQHVLGLLDEQAVQVDGVAGDALARVVGPEYEVTRLVIVLRHLGGVLLAFFRQVVGARAVARLVGLVCAVEALGAFRGFLAREVAQAVVFGLGVGGRVVEC